jgi:hypothetical protein
MSQTTEQVFGTVSIVDEVNGIEQNGIEENGIEQNGIEPKGEPLERRQRVHR